MICRRIVGLVDWFAAWRRGRKAATLKWTLSGLPRRSRWSIPLLGTIDLNRVDRLGGGSAFEGLWRRCPGHRCQSLQWRRPRGECEIWRCQHRLRGTPWRWHRLVSGWCFCWERTQPSSWEPLHDGRWWILYFLHWALELEPWQTRYLDFEGQTVAQNWKDVYRSGGARDGPGQSKRNPQTRAPSGNNSNKPVDSK